MDVLVCVDPNHDGDEDDHTGDEKGKPGAVTDLAALVDDFAEVGGGVCLVLIEEVHVLEGFVNALLAHASLHINVSASARTRSTARSAPTNENVEQESQATGSQMGEK